jgi:glutamyl-tRNA reductase
MAILAYGLNFRTAPLDLRERIAFPEEGLISALKNLKQSLPAVAEAAILSTCNRTELYCAATLDDPDPLVDWLAGYRQVDVTSVRGAGYAHWDRDAARHLMRVATGLDSQVLGEPQIMGQVKDAVDLARTAGTLGPELHLLSQMTMNVAKQVRTDTDIGKNPISVAYVAGWRHHRARRHAPQRRRHWRDCHRQPYPGQRRAPGQHGWRSGDSADGRRGRAGTL